MSKAQTISLIARYFAAFNAHDVDAMLVCLAEDIIHDNNQKGREIGREKFRWHAANVARHAREEISDIVMMTDDSGLRAAAEYTARGTYIATMDGLPEANGQSFSLAAGSFFEIDGEVISRISTYYNRADLIAQLERK